MNIWRKRFAVLIGEKLWLIKSRNGIEKARCIKITATTKVHDRIPSHDYPFCFLVNDNNKLHYFRAVSGYYSLTHLLTHLLIHFFSESDQLVWKEQIYAAIKLYRDSDCIKIAEMIITDEESARSYRLQKSLTNVLQQDGVMHALGSGSNSNSSDGERRLYEFHQTTKQQIERSVHSASSGESIVHSIHSKESVIADAMAFLLAVQRYKELHRHDLKVSLNRLWSYTLHLFQTHLSRHLVG